jgi:hypothetical protein
MMFDFFLQDQRIIFNTWIQLRNSILNTDLGFGNLSASLKNLWQSNLLRLKSYPVLAQIDSVQ